METVAIHKAYVDALNILNPLWLALHNGNDPLSSKLYRAMEYLRKQDAVLFADDGEVSNG